MNGMNCYSNCEAERARSVQNERAKITTLTELEREVITLACYGFKDTQIAQSLRVNDAAVRHQLNSIYTKLGVSDRLDLVLYAYAHGLAPLQQ